MAKKGFTLIELLVVIGILAVLATVTALILNPAELLRQSRDSTRVSDLATLTSAISLYITDQSAASSFSLGACSSAAGTAGRTNAVVTNGSFVGPVGAVATGTRANSGAGWVDINFTNISSGAPLAQEPVDPSNSVNLIYRYACDATGTAGKFFEIDAAFESVKYATTLNLAGLDGGDTNTGCSTLPMVTTNATGCAYEVGNKLTL